MIRSYGATAYSKQPVAFPAKTRYIKTLVNHTVFINPDNIIEVHLVGDILPQDAEQLGKQTIGLVTKLLNTGHRVNILACYTQARNTEVLSVAMAKSFFKVIKIDKMAAYGANNETAKDLQDVIDTAQLADRLRIFKTREEALAWLAL